METTVRKPAVHYRWMDYLNVASCFAVVLLHCSTSIFLNMGDRQWFLDVVYQCLFVFAVPCFFMISGANLLGYRERYDTKTFLGKRFSRVLLTLVLASIIVYICEAQIQAVGQSRPLSLSLGEFLGGFLQNKICDVYWFFYAILAIYLVTPIFSLMAYNQSLLRYCLALSAFSTFVLPVAERFIPGSLSLSYLKIPYVDGWIFYYFLGYYLVHGTKRKMPRPSILALVAAVALAAMIGMTIKTNIGHTVLSGRYAPYDNFYGNASGILAATYATCIFLLFRSKEERMQASRAYGIVRKLSTLSLGIYAFHMVLINVFDLFVPHRILWDLIVRPVVVIALAAVIALLFNLLLKAVLRLFSR